MTRQELLLALALLFLLGLGATVKRVIEAHRTGGVSMRLQVFIPLASTTLVLSAAFAIIVIDRFTARASVFALRAAEDEARVVAELAAGALETPGTALGGSARLRVVESRNNKLVLGVLEKPDEKQPPQAPSKEPEKPGQFGAPP